MDYRCLIKDLFSHSENTNHHHQHRPTSPLPLLFMPFKTALLKVSRRGVEWKKNSKPQRLKSVLTDLHVRPSHPCPLPVLLIHICYFLHTHTYIPGCGATVRPGFFCFTKATLHARATQPQPPLLLLSLLYNITQG